MGWDIALLVMIILGGSIAGVAALVLAVSFRSVLEDLNRRQKVLETEVKGLRTELESAKKSIRDTLSGLRKIPAAKPEPYEPPIAPPVVVPKEEPRSIAPEPLLDEELLRPPYVPPAPATEPKPIPHQASSTDQQWWAGLEESLGKRWMTWAGAGVLFLSVGFFIKYAFDNQWLGPTGRVVLGIMAGIGLLGAGDHFVRRDMRALGQGLTGGGLAILYLALFSAFSLYQLIPQRSAFGCMVFVTAVGMSLAVLHDAIPLGIIATLGGLISPLLVSTGTDPRDSLFAYLAVLNLGVLGVAFFKRWRILDCIAFAGTWLLFFGWFDRFYTSSAMLPACLWISVFFLIFLVLPFAYQLRMASEATVESFLLALANAIVSFSLLYRILHPKYAFVLGFVALTMAACYVSMAAVCRSRIPQDARSLFGFVGLSVVLLTLAVPLHLKLHGITLAWALEGPVLLFLGYQFNYRPVRIAGLVILFLAGVNLFARHWPLHQFEFAIFLNRQFATALFLPAAMAAYGVIHHQWRDQGTELDRVFKLISAIGAGFATTIIVQHEVSQWAYLASSVDHKLALARSLGTFVWAMGSLGFLSGFILTRQRVVFYSGIVALLIAALNSAVCYGSNLGSQYHLFLNIRFFVGLVVGISVVGYAFVLHICREDFQSYGRELMAGIYGLAGVFPLTLLSMEVYCYCHDTIRDYSRAQWLGQMSLSLVWSFYAILALAIGFWRQIRTVRLAALGLLVLTGVKLMLIDMSMVQQIYRIISFVVLGIVMIGASYIYHKLEKRLGSPDGG